MDIRSKTLLIIVLTFSILIMIHLISYTSIILGSYSEMESEIISQDLERVVTAVGDDINHLYSVANEWSLKDSVILFLNRTDPSIIDSEINEAAFERLQFNLINIYDSYDSLIIGAEYDINKKEFSNSSLSSNNIIQNFVHYSHYYSRNNGTMGIIKMPDGPMLISVLPVFGKGGSNPDYLGTIVMGRYFDDKILMRLSSITGFEIKSITSSEEIEKIQPVFLKYDYSGIPFIARGETDTIILQAPIEIEPLDENFLRSYILINDVYGDEALILETEIPRQIYLKGKESTLYSINLFILSAGILGLVILLLLEKNVLSRIWVLSKTIDSIRKNKDSAMKVDEEGSDEISSLASNINGMLCELEESKNKIQTRLIDSEERYRLFFDSAEDMVFIIELIDDKRPGKFLEVNKTTISSLGYSREEMLSMSLYDIAKGDVIPDNPDPDRSQNPGTRLELNFRTKDDKWFPFEVTAHIFNNFGTPAIMVIARDITERKEIEGLKIDMMQKIEKNMEQFAILNDHLRNPLQVIMGQVLLGPDCNHDIILDQVEEINDIVKKIDQGWIESAKIREFLFKYYGVGDNNGK